MAEDSIETARLDALYQLNLLDTQPSESFDRITRMASQIFNLPISAISLTDHDRQWFKSRVGVEHQSIPRSKAPCAQVAETADIVLLPDLLADPYYRDSVLASQGVRFYAGAPLVTREGYGLGALCVLGMQPRQVTEAETSALRDLADMVMAQIELQHAFGRIEPVSGLPNRIQFLEDLADIGRDNPGRNQLAVLVDLARMEQLNSSSRVMGSGFVDDMVRDAARTIRAALPSNRSAYHVAPTQFAFLAEAEEDLASYVPKLRDFLASLAAKSTRRFVTTPSIGIAPFTAGETPPRDVLRTALNAAHDARRSDDLVGVYSSSSDAAHQRRFTLLNDFGTALEADDQLHVLYQPRVELSTGACRGAEALLRWRHPTLGDVSPAEFIPIIEQTSMARGTTAWVMEAVLAQLAEWRGAGLNLQVSVNVSAANLAESDFAAAIQLRLMKYRLPADALELEVTESTMMVDEAAALEQLRTLDAAGIQLAIDDFGTGYSSLAYLDQLPAHVVKIDQSFVKNVTSSERELTLVRTMINLSHAFGYRVVAEGVETQAVASAMRDMGCDEAQGYLYARPLHPEKFMQWLTNREPKTANQAAA